MTTLTPNRFSPSLAPHARIAAEIMTPDPLSIRQDATVAEATAFLGTRGFSAAPVIDDAGRPLGVVSRTDLLQRQGRRAVHAVDGPGAPGNRVGRDDTPVRDVMTPAVFCVRPGTTVAKAVEKMLALNVRRLFVVDDAGVLVGVVSAFDVIRGLARTNRAAA
jgi:CBS domain-containing protein